jgi:hypothetical protein
MFYKYKIKILIATVLFCWIGCLAYVDRIYFKRNHSFSIRFIYSSLPNNPEWDLPTPTIEQQLLGQILEQKFRYLAKGNHCYAFISEDNKYVLKFHRYPSHMRIFPWLPHPFSYLFSQRRKKIKEHNFRRLRANFTSYRDSYQNLKEETGLILLHINQTDHLRKSVTLVDKTQAEYRVPLDKVTFILQYKAEMIYTTLDRLVKEKKIHEAKQVVSHIIQLITSRCQKGYVDEDPVLRKNYGLLKDRAIHIDIGDLIKNTEISLKENYIPHVKEMTSNLHKHIKTNYPELLEHYFQEIENL